MNTREERTEAADGRLRSLLADGLKKADVPPTGVAVVAVGGYGRAELSAASDLDVMLVHDDRLPDVGAIAEALWYPLWDDGIALDHSVRTLEETRDAADQDLRTAMSVLDARHVAGDPSLTIRLRTTLLADWRRGAPRRLPELEESCRERAARVGELSSLLEPDLKEARGGLRDGVVLRALVATWLVELPHATLARLRGELLDVRDALHLVGGKRPTDRLLAELQPDVASALGLPDRETLLRRVYQAGRTLAHTSDIAWRRITRARAVKTNRRNRSPIRPGPLLTPVANGVAISDGEVVLTPDARIGQDAQLPLRAAEAAAERGLLLNPFTADRLSREFLPLPTPWPDEARRLFSALLGTAQNLLPVWETLDQSGLIEPLLPEWAHVRCRPQYSPAHRHTVDRHLLETCVQASALVRRVARPDLLLVAALLHDVGKGHDDDHSDVGAAQIRHIATRWGFPPRDVATLSLLVRHHLLLSETATRRDLDDPATIKRVAIAVGDADTLDLLAALTEADCRAIGSVAWTPWRAALLARLVERVRSRLERGAVPAPQPLDAAQRLLAARVAQSGELDIVVEAGAGGSRITVAAPDRVGLLATVAGVLALGRLGVRSASVDTIDDAGISVWAVTGDPPDPAVLRERIATALAGSLDLAKRLGSVDDAYAKPGDSIPPRVHLVPGASANATVIEVHAKDRPGLFYRLCAVLAAHDCSVRSAHVSTWATEAVDVFYLQPLAEPDQVAVIRALEASLAAG